MGHFEGRKIKQYRELWVSITNVKIFTKILIANSKFVSRTWISGILITPTNFVNVDHERNFVNIDSEHNLGNLKSWTHEREFWPRLLNPKIPKFTITVEIPVRDTNEQIHVQDPKFTKSRSWSKFPKFTFFIVNLKIYGEIHEFSPRLWISGFWPWDLWVGLLKTIGKNIEMLLSPPRGGWEDEDKNVKKLNDIFAKFQLSMFSKIYLSYVTYNVIGFKQPMVIHIQTSGFFSVA